MYQIFQECSKHSIKYTKCTITFHTMFFLKQNYRQTIIHSQTLQLSCNLFKLSQESCYLYLSISTTDISTVKTPQFSLYNSSLNPISFFKLSHITSNHHMSDAHKTLHNCPIFVLTYPKCIYICFSLYILYPKQKSTLRLFPTINNIT